MISIIEKLAHSLRYVRARKIFTSNFFTEKGHEQPSQYKQK